MAKVVVHMLGRVDGASVDTGERDVFGLCGVVGVAETTKDPARFGLFDEAGNCYIATTTKAVVTCQKCNNLLLYGTIQRRLTHEDSLGKERHPTRHARRASR